MYTSHSLSLALFLSLYFFQISGQPFALLSSAHSLDARAPWISQQIAFFSGNTTLQLNLSFSHSFSHTPFFKRIPNLTCVCCFFSLSLFFFYIVLANLLSLFNCFLPRVFFPLFSFVFRKALIMRLHHHHHSRALECFHFQVCWLVTNVLIVLVLMIEKCIHQKLSKFRARSFQEICDDNARAHTHNTYI